jgi:hypothetical protein
MRSAFEQEKKCREADKSIRRTFGSEDSRKGSVNAELVQDGIAKQLAEVVPRNRIAG